MAAARSDRKKSAEYRQNSFTCRLQATPGDLCQNGGLRLDGHPELELRSVGTFDRPRKPASWLNSGARALRKTRR
jgi:hypothetical protein